MSGNQALHDDLVETIHIADGIPQTKPPGGNEIQVFWAFFNGMWHDPHLDPGPRVLGYPEIDLLRSWASLYRGKDVQHVLDDAAELARNPELELQANLLRALCLNRLGQGERAWAYARQSLGDIEREGRWHFEMYAWRPVAHSVLAEIAQTRGDADEATHHRAEIRKLAPRSWFARYSGAATSTP